MPKKKDQTDVDPDGVWLLPEDGTQVEQAPQKIHYKPTKWKGIIDTFRCEGCSYFNTDEGTMILHVLKHVPEAERETLMNKLLDNIKEK